MHFSAEMKEDFSLKLEMVYGNEETKSKKFDPSSNKCVRIGRNKDCEVILDHTSFSRVHTSFIFNKDESCWYLQDGYGNKCSTNGTW